MKSMFINGPIPSLLVADCIQQLSDETATGGHGIFLGQIRNDVIENKRVKAIEFTSYEEMALITTEKIKKEIQEKFKLTSIIVYHSTGIVRIGELCLFVFTSAPHRKAAINACQQAVERFKAEVPIWGKELFENDSYSWKVNTI